MQEVNKQEVSFAPYFYCQTFNRILYSLNLKEEEEAAIEELKDAADNVNKDASEIQSGRAHHPGDAATDDHIKKPPTHLNESGCRFIIVYQ
jgi:hypothetical protein